MGVLRGSDTTSSQKKLDEEYSFSNEKLDFPQVIILDV